MQTVITILVINDGHVKDELVIIRYYFITSFELTEISFSQDLAL